jgi:hypothetical protein
MVYLRSHGLFQSREGLVQIALYRPLGATEHPGHLAGREPEEKPQNRYFALAIGKRRHRPAYFFEVERIFQVS